VIRVVLAAGLLEGVLTGPVVVTEPSLRILFLERSSAASGCIGLLAEIGIT